MYIKSTIKIVECRKKISHCHCFGHVDYEPLRVCSHEFNLLAFVRVTMKRHQERLCAVMNAQCRLCFCATVAVLLSTEGLLRVSWDADIHRNMSTSHPKR